MFPNKATRRGYVRCLCMFCRNSEHARVKSQRSRLLSDFPHVCLCCACLCPSYVAAYFLPLILTRPLSRLPCVGAQICPLALQHARHESHHDRGWDCVMEKERGRNFFRGRCPARDCMVLSSRISANFSTSVARKRTRPRLTLKHKTTASLLKSS